MDKIGFIRFLEASGVLLFGNFTTKSGRQTPYFINTGNFKTGAQLELLGECYSDLIMEVTGGAFDAVFGPAYKGIPLAASAACAMYRKYGLDKPYFFNRKEIKDHGEGGVFVGHKPADGEKIIFIEDVTTAGTSIRETLPLLLAAANATVEDLFIAVDRREAGSDGKTSAASALKSEFGITVHSIVTVDDIFEYLKRSGADTSAMESYMNKYCV